MYYFATAGRVGAAEREREAAGGNQGSKRGNVGERKPWTAGRGAYNGVGGSPILPASRRRLHDCSPDARRSSDAARSSARLRAQEPSQHRLQENAQLGHSDRSRELI